MGWVEDLPQLIEGRYNHGCGSYLRVSGTQVSIDSVVWCTHVSVCVQVLLVAGGWKNGHGPLSSTEVLTGDSPVWTMATPLPRIVYSAGSVTLDNTVFISGIVCCYIL